VASAAYAGSVGLSTGAKVAASGSSRVVLLWTIDELVSVGPRIRIAVANQPTMTDVPEKRSDTAGHDAMAWDLIKDTSDTELLRRFVRQFPDSPYKTEAESRIARLSDGPSPSAQSPTEPEKLGPKVKSTRSSQRGSEASPQPQRRPKVGCFTFNNRRICE